MIHVSEGRIIVYAVFDAYAGNGYGKELVGLFSSAEKADAYALAYDAETHGNMRKYAREQGRKFAAVVTVESLTLDAPVGDA